MSFFVTYAWNNVVMVDFIEFLRAGGHLVNSEMYNGLIRLKMYA